MPIQIRIVEWEAKGLRCPDHRVVFGTEESTHAISLIQMPNGVGKTTTLQLLRAALSGKGEDGSWLLNEVCSFRKKGFESDDGLFRVVVSYDDTRVTITLRFNFGDGTVRYTTTSTEHGGERDGFVLPSKIRPFLRKEFANLFVFDGELANNLLTLGKTNADSAIEDLFQLSAFDRMEDLVKDYWTHQTDRCGATETTGLKRRRNRVETLSKHLRLLKQELSDLRAFKKKRQDRLRMLERRFSAEIEGRDRIKARVREAQAALDSCRARIRELSREALSMMRTPHALLPGLADDLVKLKSCFDQVQLPETTAREFFEELAAQDECVCGRPLDDATRAALRSRAKRYLGSSEVSILNAIKSDITKYVGSSPSGPAKALDEVLAELRERTIAVVGLENDLAMAQTAAVGAAPQLEEVVSEISDLKAELDRIDGDLERFEDPRENLPDDETTGISVVEDKLKDAQRKLDEIRNTMDLRIRRDVLLKVLKAAHASARSGIASDLCREANVRIADLMPYNDIRIDSIQKHLVLRGQEAGSVGETLSVAYAFLSTLFNRSDHELPFVVDSPAGPIDFHVRRNVAELVPKLTGQFIAFVISSERPNFVGPLERAASSRVQYLTVFRKADSPDAVQRKRESEARSITGVLESADGFCVPGADFFNAFQFEDEENGNV